MKKLLSVRIFSFTLAVLFLTGTIAGCAGGPAPGGADRQKQTNTSAGAAGGEPNPGDPYGKFKPQAGKDYTMTIAGWLAGPVDNENGEVLKYYREKTGVKVVSANIDGTKYDDLINIRIASGDIPDVFSLNTFGTYLKYYNQGIILDFDEGMFKAMAPNLYKLYASECPEALAYVRLNKNNKTLLSSLAQYKYHAQFIFPFVWRKDWLKNVGIGKIPDNLKETEAALYKFAREDPDKNGKADTYGISTSGLTAVYGAYGYRPGAWSVRDGKLVYGAVQPEMKEALATLAKWYKDGLIDPEFVTSENKGGRADITHAFINDRIGLSLHADYWTWCPLQPEGLNYTEFKKNHPNPDQSLEITVPILANDGKSRNTNKASLVQGTFWVYNKKLEKEPDKIGKIFQFFDWVYASGENYTLAWYGLEGKHWEKQDGMPQPVGKYALDKGEQNKIGAYTTVGSICEPLGYQGLVRGNLDPWARKSKFDNPQLGIVNKLVVATSSYNQYWAELDKMQKEVYVNIITGKQPPDAYEKFVKDWRGSGGDILEKEATEWYNSVQTK